MILANKRILVIGLGLSGRSATEFLIAHSAAVYGVDRNKELLSSHPEIVLLKEKGLTTQYENDDLNLDEFDLIVISPGVPSSHPLVMAASEKGIPIIGEIELGCRYAKNTIIGITGTNGKTTVTQLVTHVLNRFGIKSRALGNIGLPLTKELLTISSNEVIVLELSSFQLETFCYPCLDAALLLNITPDHLDRYQNIEDYAKVKCGIEKCLKKTGKLFFEEASYQKFSYLLKGKQQPSLYGYHENCFISTDLSSVYCEGIKLFELPPFLKNKRSHEVENMLAAFSLCMNQGVAVESFVESWQVFRKPPHRIEFVLEHQGVKYYDDSKGTNIDAVIRAVQSLNGPIILIAGGVDKGFPYTPWLEEFKNKVKSICGIGLAAVKIADHLAPHIPVTIYHSLDEAVQYATQLAQKGDTILLSPGCSSYDMFKDYAHRGEEFQRIVRELAENGIRRKNDEKRYNSHCRCH